MKFKDRYSSSLDWFENGIKAQLITVFKKFVPEGDDAAIRRNPQHEMC